MSSAALTVSMYGSTSPYFAAHARAKSSARFRFAFSVLPVSGRELGRTGANWAGRQFRAGLLAPTPRGSKPMTSYCAATFFGREEAR